MLYSKNNLFLLGTIIFTLLVFNPASFSASDLLENRVYGYEIELSSEWAVDYSGYPEVIACEIGDGGRLLVEVILPSDEYETPIPDETISQVLSSFGSNFNDFRTLGDGWSSTPDGSDAYEFSFESSVDYELVLGTARIVFGPNTLMLAYYDDRLDFDFYLPEIQEAFESLAIDEKLIDGRPTADFPIDGDAIDFIDPLKSIYRNETYVYSCENPGRLTPEEVTGPGWVVFPTGEGEISIRYLDDYYNSGLKPEAFLTEILDLIFASFNRYEITQENPAELYDGRTAYILEVDSVMNGFDWKGFFVGFESDAGEPFLVSILAPNDEYEVNVENFKVLWRSFSFEKVL